MSSHQGSSSRPRSTISLVKTYADQVTQSQLSNKLVKSKGQAVRLSGSPLFLPFSRNQTQVIFTDKIQWSCTQQLPPRTGCPIKGGPKNRGRNQSQKVCKIHLRLASSSTDSWKLCIHRGTHGLHQRKLSRLATCWWKHPSVLRKGRSKVLYWKHKNTLPNSLLLRISPQDPKWWAVSKDKIIVWSKRKSVGKIWSLLEQSWLEVQSHISLELMVLD